jgi:hypothetical protein
LFVSILTRLTVRVQRKRHKAKRSGWGEATLCASCTEEARILSASESAEAA